MIAELTRPLNESSQSRACFYNMDFINTYELDSLCYLDNEYDNPVVKQYVDSLVRQEMSTFPKSSSKYLAHLPYPKLSDRCEKYQQSSEKLDMSRYGVEPPPAELERDVQAWRSSVDNAKVQLEHQGNRLMNLELAEKNASDVWLYNNQLLEKYEGVISQKISQVQDDIQAVNRQRKDEQDRVRNELNRLIRRRDDSIYKSWQINHACKQMEATLPSEVLYELNQGDATEAGGDGSEQQAKRTRLDEE